MTPEQKKAAEAKVRKMSYDEIVKSLVAPYERVDNQGMVSDQRMKYAKEQAEHSKKISPRLNAKLTQIYKRHYGQNR
jgi:23S rRNA maturation mini-RNase III